MTDTSRFGSVSSSLRMRRLLIKSRQTFWGCLGLAMTAHLLSTQISGFGANVKGGKPLTTQFVKRQPRLTKPLELKKRPQPKRRAVQRPMILVKARVLASRQAAAFRPSHMLRGLARPSVHLTRAGVLAGASVEPKVLARAIEGTKEVEHKIDMSLELLNVDLLDTGRYHAVVVQSPQDKRCIRGFFHFAYAYPSSWRNRDWHAIEQRTQFGLRRLIDAVNKYTDIRADIIARCTYDDADLFKIPWIFVFASHWGFQLTRSEILNLGIYLSRGGFILGDGGTSLQTMGNATTRKMFRDALDTLGLRSGQHWTLERLPNHHPIYHCYFDFDTGPPIAGDYKNGKVFHWMHDDSPFDYLEGITIGARVWAVMSNKSWINAWGDWGCEQYGYNWLDPTRPLQFGVNTIIFALTQEGSTTHRLVDSIQ